MLNTITAGSLQIHNSVSPNNFWVDSVEGLDAPDYRINNYDRPGEDGGVISSEFYTTRLITLTGIIKGATPAIHEANRALFASTFAISRDAYNFPVPVRITFVTLAGASYFVDAYAEKPQMKNSEILFSRFMLHLRCPKSFLFSSTAISSGAITVPTGGGFILPVILPIISSSSTGGSALITNTGNVTAYPIITLTGSLTTPYIYNATTGVYMQLNYTLAPTDVVVIDMLNKTIVLNGSTDLLYTKQTGANWWGLLVGNNNISFSTGSSSDTGNAAISFNPPYLGI